MDFCFFYSASFFYSTNSCSFCFLAASSAYFYSNSAFAFASAAYLMSAAALASAAIFFSASALITASCWASICYLTFLLLSSWTASFSSESLTFSKSIAYSASICCLTFSIYNWASAFLLESSCFLFSLAKLALAAAFLAAAALVS